MRHRWRTSSAPCEASRSNLPPGPSPMSSHRPGQMGNAALLGGQQKHPLKMPADSAGACGG